MVGPWSSWPWVLPWWCWIQPSVVCPWAHLSLLTVRTAPAKSLLHCRPRWLMPPTLATDIKGAWPCATAEHPVHHRSPPLLTPWKTQCAQSILLTAECPSMECRGIDRVRHWSCAGLGAHSGQPGGCTHGAKLRSHLRIPRVNCTHRSQPMGLFGVKGIGAPEVKFLDRCETHCSEGVLQVHVRRSRMRVRGAKMIRHRRSPATVNHAGQALAGQDQQTLSGPLLPQREIHSLWVQGGVLSQG